MVLRIAQAERAVRPYCAQSDIWPSGRTLDLCKLVRSSKSIWLSLGGSVKLTSPCSRLGNCPGRLACSPQSSLGWTMSCTTVSISPGFGLSAEGKEGSSLPMLRFPEPAGSLRDVQGVSILSVDRSIE